MDKLFEELYNEDPSTECNITKTLLRIANQPEVVRSKVDPDAFTLFMEYLQPPRLTT